MSRAVRTRCGDPRRWPRHAVDATPQRIELPAEHLGTLELCAAFVLGAVVGLAIALVAVLPNAAEMLAR